MDVPSVRRVEGVMVESKALVGGAVVVVVDVVFVVVEGGSRIGWDGSDVVRSERTGGIVKG